MHTALTQQPSKIHLVKLLFSNALGIFGFVIGFVGVIFGFIGTIFLLVSQLNPPMSYIGGLFFLLGLGFMAIGAPILGRGWKRARQTAEIEQNGVETEGQIIEMYQNYSVRVNGRHPWFVRYSYMVNGIQFEGQQNVWEQPVYEEGETAIFVKYLLQSPEKAPFNVQHT